MFYQHLAKTKTIDIADWPQQWAKRTIIFIGATIALLGCTVLIGWYTHIVLLIQVLPSMVPMQYNTALGFMLSGVGVVFLIFNRPLIGVTCLGLVTAIGLITLIQYLTGLNFGLDQLFMEHYILVKTSHPGRMAPNTALCFLLAGAACILRVTYSKQAKWRQPIVALFGAAVLVLGTLAFVGYMIGAETGYGWGQLTRMAVHTAFGFILLSTAILIMAWVPIITAQEAVTKADFQGTKTASSTIAEHRQIITVSILVMCVVSLSVGISIVRELYHTALKQERISLIQTLDSWAELITVQAKHNLQEHPNNSEVRTLSAITDAFKKFSNPRETEEIILAKQETEGIRFLLELQQRKHKPRPKHVQKTVSWAEPMRRALAGQIGMLIGNDYHGKEVLAAYHPITSLGIGLVIKVDLEEIQRPFLRAIMLASGIALVVIILGTMVFILKVNPMIRHMVATHDLEQAVLNLGHILDHSWNEIYTFRADTFHFIEVSKIARQNLGYSMDELKQLTLLDLEPEFTHDQFEALINPLRQDNEAQIIFETTQQRKDGTQYPVEVRLHLFSLETPPVFVAIIQDISVRMHYIDKLKHKTLYDSLTELPNRFLLQERLKQALKIARREASQLAVIIIDIVRLGEINNLMGHHNGDLVLREVGSRLQNALRESDTVAHIGSDEFSIILPAVDITHIHVAAKKIGRLFEQPILIEDTPLEIEVAIGIALYPDHGDTPTILLQHADIAMLLAKYEKTVYSIYNPEDDPSSLLHLKLHGELRQALNEEMLTLYYQPKIDIKTGRITSVEALARWPHPTNGMISPIEFMPMIEQSGMVQPFTFWVLTQAIEQSKLWTKSGITLTIAVNLSTRNLLDPSLPNKIGKLLELHEVSPTCLALEITESAIMFRPKSALKTLFELHEMGIKISIDDFGTGYSSLAYLKEMPLHELKIDQSFIFGLTENSKDSVIVRSTIDLAHNLGLLVVAEGVENQDTLDYLASLNCDIAQGYYISRPMPEHELERWLLT